MIAALLPLLLLQVGNPADLGPSPMAEQGHQHRWEVIQDDEEGTGWIDRAWQGEGEHEGYPIKLILLRVDIRGADAITGDLVVAADCERQLLGIKDGYLFESDYGDQMRLPIPGLTMDFAETPPSRDDLEMLAFACGKADAAK